MSEHWIGYSVSVNCGDNFGTYQGQILRVDPKEQTLTLTKVFRNGFPVPTLEVTIRALDIVDLSIIETAQETSEHSSSSTVAVKKPVPKRAGKTVSENLANAKGAQLRESPRRPVEDGRPRGISVSEGNKTPSKKERQRQRWSEKDEACFGTPIDHILDHEFDFEKNLALFNKQAFYDEINASQRPDVVRQTDGNNRRPQKYRHDENIIASRPTMYRQIIVPSPDEKEYVTDSGLVVPSVTIDLHEQMFSVAERFGFSTERRTELMGRAATEMALQLLGGGHRLNPHNVHQWPIVVALCGPHNQGAMGINCARQLASHGVKTVVFLTDPMHVPPHVVIEVALFKLTRNKLISSIKDLPTVPVDLIILALEDHRVSHRSRTQPVYLAAAAWANDNRAPVLALDPPPSGTSIETKFSLVPVLPLSYGPENGKIYLCNLSFPLDIFKEVGMKYNSPFGPKFVIPLHPNDS